MPAKPSPETLSPEAAAYTAKDFRSQLKPIWCSGCGAFGVVMALCRALAAIGRPSHEIAFISGIGCSSRFPYYIGTYGIHSIHGRAPTLATGLKCARPDLQIWVITGDGDSLAIGGNHFHHVLRRNVDVNILLFNNRIYGLTKGQYSPTSEFGKRTKSSPMGTIEQPIHPLHTALAAQATFVARTVYSNPRHMTEVFEAAARHRGGSFVEILQSCKVFNGAAFADMIGRKSGEESRVLLEHGKPVCFGPEGHKRIAIRNVQPVVIDTEHEEYDEREVLIHDAHARSPALAALLATLEPPDFPTVLGVFRDVERPTYNELLVEQNRQFVQKRGPGDLEKLLNSGTTWEVE